MRILAVIWCCVVVSIAFMTGDVLNRIEGKYGIFSFDTENAKISEIPDEESEYEPDKININTASKEELCRLYGIGERMAERIIRYREENGNFRQSADIMKVAGIGKETFSKIEDDITTKIKEESK